MDPVVLFSRQDPQRFTNLLSGQADSLKEYLTKMNEYTHQINEFRLKHQAVRPSSSQIKDDKFFSSLKSGFFNDNLADKSEKINKTKIKNFWKIAKIQTMDDKEKLYFEKMIKQVEEVSKINIEKFWKNPEAQEMDKKEKVDFEKLVKGPQSS